MTGQHPGFCRTLLAVGKHRLVIYRRPSRQRQIALFAGIGSLLSFGAPAMRTPTVQPVKSAEDGIAHDWAAVGGSLRTALDQEAARLTHQ